MTSCTFSRSLSTSSRAVVLEVTAIWNQALGKLCEPVSCQAEYTATPFLITCLKLLIQLTMSPSRHPAPWPLLLLVLSSFLPVAFPYAETGRWDMNFAVSDSERCKPFAKSMFNQTSVFLSITVDCNAAAHPDAAIDVSWTLRRTGKCHNRGVGC